MMMVHHQSHVNCTNVNLNRAILYAVLRWAQMEISLQRCTTHMNCVRLQTCKNINSSTNVTTTHSVFWLNFLVEKDCNWLVLHPNSMAQNSDPFSTVWSLLRAFRVRARERVKCFGECDITDLWTAKFAMWSSLMIVLLVIRVLTTYGLGAGLFTATHTFISWVKSWRALILT